ncbi:hypothetical protein C8J57DRAFT_1213971 [Mycena rebaudengoi]|nr:hypothetical protein C8J57DRAFT_1213971 [Mycena rebaudengoi]
MRRKIRNAIYLLRRLHVLVIFVILHFLCVLDIARTFVDILRRAEGATHLLRGEVEASEEGGDEKEEADGWERREGGAEQSSAAGGRRRSEGWNGERAGASVGKGGDSVQGGRAYEVGRAGTDGRRRSTRRKGTTPPPKKDTPKNRDALEALALRIRQWINNREHPRATLRDGRC